MRYIISIVCISITLSGAYFGCKRPTATVPSVNTRVDTDMTTNRSEYSYLATVKKTTIPPLPVIDSRSTSIDSLTVVINKSAIVIADHDISRLQPVSVPNVKDRQYLTAKSIIDEETQGETPIIAELLDELESIRYDPAFSTLPSNLVRIYADKTASVEVVLKVIATAQMKGFSQFDIMVSKPSGSEGAVTYSPPAQVEMDKRSRKTGDKSKPLPIHFFIGVTRGGFLMEKRDAKQVTTWRIPTLQGHHDISALQKEILQMKSGSDPDSWIHVGIEPDIDIDTLLHVLVVIVERCQQADDKGHCSRFEPLFPDYILIPIDYSVAEFWTDGVEAFDFTGVPHSIYEVTDEVVP